MFAERRMRHQFENAFPKIWLYPDQTSYLVATGVSPAELSSVYPNFELTETPGLYDQHHHFIFRKENPAGHCAQEGELEFLYHDDIKGRPMLRASRRILSTRDNDARTEREVSMMIYAHYGAHLILNSSNSLGIDQVTLAYNSLGDVVPTRRAFQNGVSCTTKAQAYFEPPYPMYPNDDQLAHLLTDEDVGAWTAEYLEREWRLGVLLDGAISPQELLKVLVTTPPLKEHEGMHPVDLRYMMEQSGLLPQREDLRFDTVFGSDALSQRVLQGQY